MVVLNADWERKRVPGAIGELVRDLMVRNTPFLEASLIYVSFARDRRWANSKKGKNQRSVPSKNES